MTMNGMETWRMRRWTFSLQSAIYISNNIVERNLIWKGSCCYVRIEISFKCFIKATILGMEGAQIQKLCTSWYSAWKDTVMWESPRTLKGLLFGRLKNIQDKIFMWRFTRHPCHEWAKATVEYKVSFETVVFVTIIT